MQPNEKITGYYDLDILTGQALREAEAKDAVTALDALFNNTEATVIPKDMKLSGGASLTHVMAELTSGNSHMDDSSFQQSEPYDTFEHNGVTFESRIFRVSSVEITENHKKNGFVNKTIYLIGLVPEGQSKLSLDNFKFGIVRNNESGEQAFFGISSPAEARSRADILELTPENETLVVEELRKATAAASRSE